MLTGPSGVTIIDWVKTPESKSLVESLKEMVELTGAACSIGDTEHGISNGPINIHVGPIE